MKKLMFASLLLLALPLTCIAQVNVQKQESAKVYFRQNSVSIAPQYEGNGETLKKLSSLLKPFFMDTAKVQGRIHIMSSASPEGASITNDNLVNGRARAIAAWMSQHFKVEVGYEVDQMGVDWATLTTLVETMDGVPMRNEMLDILRNTPESERQQQLEKLGNGKPYQWIYTRIYPKLRYAAVSTEIWYASEIRLTTPEKFYFEAEGGQDVIRFVKNVEDKVVPTVRCDATWISDIVATAKDVTFRVAPNTITEPRQAVIYLNIYGNTYPVNVYQKAAAPAPVVEATPEPAPAPEPVIEEPVIVEKVLKPFYMAAKTNLLFDAALVPNIGLEFSLGKQWSIAGNWMYAWWHNNSKHDYWRTYGGELELRKWFGKKASAKPLTGHHIGIYGQGVTYDFELGKTGYLSDFSYGAGISYGYSAPIGRRLNLDFVIGLGYFSGEYKEYDPIDGHYVWQATKNRHWFGPTKAEVSLVWLIGRDNVNAQKGGKR